MRVVQDIQRGEWELRFSPAAAKTSKPHTAGTKTRGRGLARTSLTACWRVSSQHSQASGNPWQGPGRISSRLCTAISVCRFLRVRQSERDHLRRCSHGTSGIKVARAVAVARACCSRARGPRAGPVLTLPIFCLSPRDYGAKVFALLWGQISFPQQLDVVPHLVGRCAARL